MSLNSLNKNHTFKYTFVLVIFIDNSLVLTSNIKYKLKANIFFLQVQPKVLEVTSLSWKKLLM